MAGPARAARTCGRLNPAHCSGLSEEKQGSLKTTEEHRTAEPQLTDPLRLVLYEHSRAPGKILAAREDFTE